MRRGVAFRGAAALEVAVASSSRPSLAASRIANDESRASRTRAPSELEHPPPDHAVCVDDLKIGLFSETAMENDFGPRLGAFNSPVYRKLFPAQEHVLVRYAAQYLDNPNVAIELPTGVGKTLIALLLADYALERGWAVAYLTGSNVLAQQVQEQAQNLPGLVAHRFWGGHYPGAALDDYHQAQAIGIMNYWVYFNSSPKVDPADLVIFDDAHLAEQPLAGLFTARIGRAAYPELYTKICDVVRAHTNAYETLPAMRDGSLPFGAPPELLAFNDWDSVRERVADLIDDSSFADSDDRFVWRDLRAKLPRCGVLIGPAAVEIRPYHPPSQILPWVNEAKQRVYMSATLGTMDDLERRLGIGPIERIDVPSELHAGSTGRRLFVVNPSSDASVTQPLGRLVLELAGDQERVAWLCSSHQEADQVQGVLTRLRLSTYRLRPGDDAALEAWRAARGGHLIAAGRFDGLDFAGDVCRLVVLPSVPTGSSEFERFVVAYLGDATYMRHRIGQRVTQALGRANRIPSDWAIYVGLDPAFAGVLAQPAIRTAMDPSISAVVRGALELHSEGTDAIEQAVRQFWSGEEVVRATTSTRRPGRTTARPSAGGSASFEVGAATSLWLGDFRRAAQQAAAASDRLEELAESEHSAFWRYVEAHARFAAGGDNSIADAVSALRSVVDDGPRTAWFIRLQRTLDDLQGRVTAPSSHDELFLHWDAWLRESGAGVTRELTRARSQLTGTHDQKAEGLLTLARLAGAYPERPTGPSATDVRWTWISRGSAERRVWEIKTGSTSERVPRDDVNQVLGQLQIETQDHPRTHVLGCLLTTYLEMEADAAAAAREKVAVIHESAVMRLFESLADRLITYQRLWGGGVAAERGLARSQLETRLPTPDWLRRLLAPSQGRVLTDREVDEIFTPG
jgi:hypothetical protein